MLYFKLAWRNIWRNKRRTLITMASVIMAVLLSSVMRSMQQGQYDQMIDNTVGSFTGHIQIQSKGYQDEATLDNSFEQNKAMFETINQIEGVGSVIPRLDSYALAAGEKRSRATLVVGIDIEDEKNLSEPDEKVVEGSYFKNNSEHSVLISQGLAEFLNIEAGDTLILLGQGYHGMSANGAFPVKGIMKFGIPDMNDAMVYMPIETAQDYFGAYGRLTAGVILIENPKKVYEIAAEIKKHVDEELSVLEWQILMPSLVQAIEADSGSSYIILLILYMVVGFGIFGTVLMMTAERSYEFGVMVAIGTSRGRMSMMLIMEMVCITLLGVVTGIIFSLPVIYYFNINPLQFTGEAAQAIADYGMEPFVAFSTDPNILLNQAIIVMIITLLISLYPLLHMRKLEPVKAMRS